MKTKQAVFDGYREDVMANKQSTRLLSLAALISVGYLLLLPTLVSAASVDIARTGQTTCYNEQGQVIDCTGTGQDGESRNGVAWPDPRFTDNGDGTITDNLTGLTWLRDTECIGRRKWAEALDAVNVLASGSCGLTDGSVARDWRMPNYLELISIANLGAASSIAWFESIGFINLEGFGYYSSTTSTQDHSSVLGYQFRDRFSGSQLKSGGYQTWPVKGVSTGPAKVWKTGQTTCHGVTRDSIIPCTGTGQDGEHQAGEPQPDTRFVDNADGTVTDNLTGLIWLQNIDCFGPRTWSDALTDSNNLADGACGLTDGSKAGDWRLPNPLEVVSLVDYSQLPPMLTAGHPFTNFTYKTHWTSATWPASTIYGYAGGPASRGTYSNAQKSEAEWIVSWPVRGGNVIDIPELIFADDFESEPDETISPVPESE